MRPRLDKLFEADEPPRQICTVLGRKFQGRYKLRDGSGRIVEADSSATWRPDQTVVVQAGRIVDAAAGSNPEVIEV